MTAIEDAHTSAAELSRWEPVRMAWAAIHATAWNDGIEQGITKPQWALAYAQRLKQFAESVRAAGLVDRIDLMMHSAGDDDQEWAWRLVQMALTKKERFLATKIEGLPASCNWGTTFNEDLPSSFVTGVISRGGFSPDRLRIVFVRDLRKACKPGTDGSRPPVIIAPEYLDAWAEIERIRRKRFRRSNLLAAINKLTSEVAERFDIRIYVVDAMNLNTFWDRLEECEAIREAETARPRGNDAVVGGAEAGSKPRKGKQPKTKPKGRSKPAKNKRLPPNQVSLRETILSRWGLAKSAGTAAKDFCKDEGANRDSPVRLTEPMLRKFISWKCQRVRRNRDRR